MRELDKIFHLKKEREIEWIKKQVETMTGQNFDLLHPTSEIIQTYYSKRYFKLSQAVIRLVNPHRGKKMKTNYYTLTLGLLGALKLILQGFNVDISGITDENINATANGVAALAAIIGVYISHQKPTEVKSDAQYKGDTGSAV